MRALCLWLSLVAVVVPAPAFAASFAEELAAQLRLGAGSAVTEEDSDALAALERFYRDRALRPVWVSEERASERASQLAALLANADVDGLDPEDYGVAAIDSLLGATRPDLLAQLEVRLSLGLIGFATHLGQGRTAPNISDPKLYIFRDEVDRAAVIAAAADAPDLAALIDGYRPQTPRYDRLKAALADYRDLAAAEGWTAIPAGRALKPGMTDPRVALLRDRLRLWGDLEDDNDLARTGGDPSLYDDAMFEAVKWMQYRHGLEQDGVVGPKTLAALNVPVETRIEQMILNLERRRWMPDDFGQRYVFVNLADFYLKVVDEPKTILDMRVVVGKPYHRTPVFSETMKYIVINPFWNVPPSIARRELLPKIQQDVNYLAENNFTLFSDWTSGAKIVDPAAVDWTGVTGKSFRFKMRQGSGDGNALGRIKFMFPNRFNVYLHDTPAKALFAEPVRSFSHGCIRVQDPPALAEAVLALTEGWSRERIEQTIESGKRTIVTLAQSLPVHISYLTSWVNKDGSVHFRGDIYKRDATLADAILGPRATRIAQ